ETSTMSDAKNCGACSHVCAGADSVQGCMAGLCAITSCSQGFSDCDMDPRTGCEVSTGTDPMNCGGCGKACPMAANATVNCANAMCGIGACNFGFADCDMDP